MVEPGAHGFYLLEMRRVLAAALYSCSDTTRSGLCRIGTVLKAERVQAYDVCANCATRGVRRSKPLLRGAMGNYRNPTTQAMGCETTRVSARASVPANAPLSLQQSVSLNAPRAPSQSPRPARSGLRCPGRRTSARRRKSAWTATGSGRRASTCPRPRGSRAAGSM